MGWVRSIEAPHNAAWVSNMHVIPEYRRQGIAQALMSMMLRGDEEREIRVSVLLASMVGAKLYPTIGYERVGQLLLLAPRKEVWKA